ncbi:MAG: SAM-dependent methyltransferase [Oscillospiraceae bacterium]|nr:SAM-dependent methyltransferase [Oscillospiraceae bacterium]
MSREARVDNKYQKRIVDTINQLSDKRSRWDVWNDFVRLVAVSLANGMPAGRRDDRENTYKQIAGKYSSDELGQITKAFGAIVEGLEENPEQDFLGTLFVALGLSDEWKGQFFTPYDISRVMAATTIGDSDVMKAKIEGQGFVSVNDPACGAGSLLIAFANECRRLGINYQTSVLFVAQDIDELAALMCYIQLSLLGCPGYIVVGNSLSNPAVCVDQKGLVPADETSVWYTPMYYRNVWQARRALVLVKVGGGIDE